MATLNQLKKAPILNEAGSGLLASGHVVTSSDTGVVKVSNIGGTLYAIGVTGGNAKLTATRSLDGATSTLDVTVVASAPFAISLGTESAA